MGEGRRNKPHDAQGTLFRLHVRLLDGIYVEVGGVACAEPRLKKLGALVAYLALNAEGVVSRRDLASHLWPESAPSQQAATLRRLLFELRRRWPLVANGLIIDEGSVGWRFPDLVKVDAFEFERVASAATTEAALRSALRLYPGDMPEIDYAWAHAARERLRALHTQVIERLLDRLEGERRYDEACALIEGLSALPADEALSKRFLRLATLSGGPVRVDRAYALIVERFRVTFDDLPTGAIATEQKRLKQVARASHTGPAFVGRQEEWRRLTDAWASTQAGHPTLLWLQGEPGVGKTFLLGQFRAWALVQDVRVFFGRAAGAPGAPALEPILEALDEPAALMPTPPAGRDTVAPSAGSFGAPDQRSLELRRYRLLASRLWAGGPAVLVLDDMHDADDDTWRWLRYVLDGQSDVRLLVVVASRDGRATVTRRRDFFVALSGHVRRSVLFVRPLPVADARALVEGAAHLPEPTLDEVLELGQGNPLHLLELARAAADELALPGSMPVAPTYEAALVKRLRSLPAPQRRLVEALALMGRPVSVVGLKAALAEARSPALDDLVRAHLLAWASPGSIGLAHDLLRAPIVAALSQSRRRRLGARLAQAFARHEGAIAPYDLASLWEVAGRLDEAREAYGLAATLSEGTLNLRSALPAYDALIRLTPPAERAEHRVRQGDALYALGERVAATEAYEEAMRLGIAHGRFRTVSLARLGLGRIQADAGAGEVAQAHMDQSIAYFRATGETPLLARALIWRAEVAEYRAEYELAGRLLGEAADLAERAGDRPLGARVENDIGFARYEQGHLRAAKARYERALALAEEAGSIPEALLASANLAVAEHELGHLEAAYDLQRRVAELAHESGQLHYLLKALANLGVCYQSVAQWHDADVCLRAAYRLARDLGDQRVMSIVANHLAYAFGRQGEMHNANRWWGRATALARGFGMPRYVCLYARHWAEMLLDAGDVRRAASVIRAAWPSRAAARESERTALSAQYVRWAHAVGKVSDDQARRRLSRLVASVERSDTRAMVQYVLWQITGLEVDRSAAERLVADVLLTRQHTYWRRCYLALTGELKPLSELSEPPAWVADWALPIEDLDVLGETAARGVDQ